MLCLSHRASELDPVGGALNWMPEQLHVEQTSEAASCGNGLTIEIGGEQVTESVTSFGRLGVSAETVAAGAIREPQSYLASDASVGEHLTDQRLIPLALAGGGSFPAQKHTDHTTTILSDRGASPMTFIFRENERHVIVRVANRT